MPGDHLDVFISSTSTDLPDHRRAVVDAILGIGLFPSGMEHWGVEDANPVEFCRKKVESAELFIGIYAHRYGWRPDGPGAISITEMEYDWAGERGIPRFCFVMDEHHPWPIADMELDAKPDLDRFKAHVQAQIVGFFTTPDDLKAQVLQALAPYAQKQDLSGIAPYLNQLHHDSLQSGLLRTLDPRSKDPAGRSTQVTVDQVYTPLDTRGLSLRDEAGQFAQSQSELNLDDILARDVSPVPVMTAANDLPRLVVLGDPGSGKSTFVSFLALGLTGHLIDPESDWLDRLTEQGWTLGAYLPLHVTLRDFAQDMGDPAQHGTAQSLLGHIGRQLDRCGCANALPAVQDAMHRGETLLLLDGLDEVPGDRREVVRDAVSAIMRAYPDCRVLITCRILSYANPEWQIPGTESVTLAPFDDDKIAHFVRAWYTASTALGHMTPDTAQTRIDDLSAAVRDERLQDMAANPMLLTVMAIVHNHRGALPRETARLYQECVEILMWKWKPDAARHLREELELDDESDLYRILWHIAYEAHQRQGDQVGAADIPQKDVMEIAALDHLDGNWGKAQRFCDYVEERAGLIVGRGGADNQRRVYAFPHRTFQEFLAGCHIADHVDFIEIIGEKASQGANWREVALLATGHMLFNKTDRNQPIAAAQYILAHDPVTDEDWQAAWLAGDVLLLIGLQTVEKHRIGAQVLRQARQRLADLVGGGHLDPIERAAAGRTLGHLGDPRPGVGLRADGLPDIDWVEIPAGEFLMGSDPAVDPTTRSNETPQQTIHLSTFYISRYPVTYAQFETFVNEGGYQIRECWTEAGWSDKGKRIVPALWNDPDRHIPNHPVVGVTWYAAHAFTQWLSDRLGLDVRLPTEQEWEKAARGTDGRIYPYGNEFDPVLGNTTHSGINRTSAVGMFPGGKSPYDILDASGNVWEWCVTQWLNSYEQPEDNDPTGDARRVLRGGAFSYDQPPARCAYRYFNHPDYRRYYYGFRVCCAFPI